MIAERLEDRRLLAVLFAHDADDPVRAIAPSEAAYNSFGLDWIGGAEPFDDAAWAVTSGSPNGVGYDRGGVYDPLIGLDLEASMYDVSATVFVRAEFDVADPTAVDRLTLDLRYDDGYIAWLNGIEIARTNATTIYPAWSDTATAEHQASTTEFETLDLADAIANLRAGTNVLAIRGLNDSATGDDALIQFTLTGESRSGPPLAVDDAATTQENTPVTIDVVANDQPGSDPLDPTTVVIRTPPANGTAVANADGTITYTPNAIFNGHDTFTYTVRDNTGAGQTGEQMLVARDAAVRAFVPFDDVLGTTWRGGDEPFDDSAWTAGTFGVGYDTSPSFVDYGPFIGLNVQSPLQGNTTTVYMRTSFTLTDPVEVVGLTLRMRYDDGFAAFVNGVQVASAAAPATLAYNSATEGETRGDANAVNFQDFDLSQSIGALQTGGNVLAIHGLNQSLASSDLLMQPELIATIDASEHESNAATVTVDVEGVDFAPIARDDAYAVDEGQTLVVDATSGGTVVLGPNQFVWSTATGGNGHVYERVQQSHNWDEARQAAAALSLGGIAGHLATITSAAEQQFLDSVLPGDGAWIGGFQDTTAPDYSEPSGGWRWVTGEPWGYTNWRTNEPNNAGAEHFVSVEGHAWNDIRGDVVWDSFWVEYPVSGVVPQQETVVPSDSPWLYWDSGQLPASDAQNNTWRQTAYNDASWTSGAAPLGYGDGDEATVVSYGSDANNKHITTWFRKHFAIEPGRAARADQLTIELLRDDGASVYINGVEVLRDNLPGTLGDGTIGPATTAQVAISGTEEFSFLPPVTLDLTLPAYRDLLRDGDNVVAVEVHQIGGNSSDISFDLRMSARFVATPGVLGNDTEPDGQTMSAVLETPPTNGVLDLAVDGTFTYSPNAGFAGVDTFTYRASDGLLVSDPATVTITVNHVAPIASDDDYTTDEDTPLVVDATLGVLANDVDSQGHPLTASVVAAPAHGTLVVNADGSFVYTPDANYNGADSFTYVASDDAGLSSQPATVSIEVDSVNDAPTAVDDSYSTFDTGLLIVSVPYNDPLRTSTVADFDTPGTPFALAQHELSPGPSVIAGGPTGAFLRLTDTSSVLTNSVAFDRTAVGKYASIVVDFDFRITPGTNAGDGFGFILLNTERFGSTGPAPHINGEEPNAAGSVAIGFDIFGNAGETNNHLSLHYDGSRIAMYDVPDSSLDLDSGEFHRARLQFRFVPTGLEVFATLTASGGTAVDAIAGDILPDVLPYEARLAFSGRTGQFTSRQDIDNVSAAFTGPVNGGLVGVLGNDRDEDADVLTAEFVETPDNGILDFNANGTFTYTPNPGFVGDDRFTYRAWDGQTYSNVATVTLNVAHNTPTAGDDTYQVDEDAVLDVPAPTGVLANDVDTLEHPLAAILEAGPDDGALTFNIDGSFRYVPNGNFHGVDTFTYRASDGQLTSEPATVTIAVNSVNDLPVAGDDEFTIDRGTPLVLSAPSVVAETIAGTSFVEPATDAVDYGAAGGELGFTAAATPSATELGVLATDEYIVRGVSAPLFLSFDAVDIAEFRGVSVRLDVRSFEDSTGSDFEPEDFFRAQLGLARAGGPVVLQTIVDISGDQLKALDNGLAGAYTTFRADVPDGFLTATLTIETSVDSTTERVFFDDIAFVGIPAAAGNVVLANDSDGDGDELTVRVVTPPMHGVIEEDQDGTLRYTPDPLFVGDDSFTYVANDGQADSNVATVTIHVLLANLVPTAADDAYATNEDEPLVVPAGSGLLANDIDLDQDLLSVRIIDTSQRGALTAMPDGSFRYTPAADYFGSDAFTYVASDGRDDSDLATVTIDVSAVNDAPTAVDDAYSVEQGGTLDVAGLGGGASYADVVMSSNPLAYWRLGEASGTTAVDSAGNHDGVYVGAVNLGQDGAIAGDSDTAIDLDGNLGYVRVDNSAPFNLGNDFTIAAWIRVDQSGAFQRIVSNRAGSSGGYGFGLNSGTLWFTTYGWRDYNTTATIEPGRWYHVAVAFDSSNRAMFYRDGTLVQTVSGSEPAEPSNQGLTIGRQPTASAAGFETFDGQIDEVVFYNRSLTDAEIAAQYVAGVPEIANSVADFSGVQGQDGWHYGYYNRTTDGDGIYQSGDFIQFPDGAGGWSSANFWDAGNDRWKWFNGSPPWTEVLREQVHPNGTNSGQEHWAVRRWVSDFTGGTTISGHLAKRNTGGGDGVRGIIYVDGVMVYDRVIGATDGVGVDFAVNATLTVGAVVDFVLTPNGGDFADGSYFTAQVRSGSINSTTTELFTRNVVWHYRDDITNGSPYPTDGEGDLWNEADYDDAAWPTGPAVLGYDVINAAPVATFIGFGGNANDKYRTALFRRTFDVDDAESVVSLDFDALIDDGAAVYINGREVLRHNLPGTLGDDTLRTDTLAFAVGDESNYLSFVVDLAAFPGLLVDGTNTIAVEVHQVNANSSDLGFDLSMVATVVPDPADAGVLGNDTDVEDDPLTAELLAGPQHGSLEFTADGTFVYTPAAGFFGNDSFTYRAYDGADYSDAATVRITVTRNLVAAADEYAVDEDGLLIVPRSQGVLANDAEFADTTVTAELVSAPARGTVTLAANGAFHYRPAPDFFGTDTFAYRTTDGIIASDPATVTITVAVVNDAPVVRRDVYSVDVGETLDATMASGSGVVADSFAEFSGVQGQNGWYYGYYNRTTDGDGVYRPNEFTAFPNAAGGWSAANFYDVNVSRWHWFNGDPPWTAISDDNMHPNGANNGAEHWAIRRWVSDVAGRVTIGGSLRLVNPSEESGVMAFVIVDGNTVYSRTIPAGNGAAVGFFAPVNVAIGSTIDFVVSPNGTEISDTTQFVVTIREGIATIEQLLPQRSTWKYRDDISNGSPYPVDVEGDSWTEGDYNDSGWPSGPAILGYGGIDAGTTATTIGFGGNSSNKQHTALFRRTFQVDEADRVESLLFDLLADDSAAIFINGVEVLRHNLPGTLGDGSLGTNTLALTTGDESGYSSPRVDLGRFPGLLIDGVNTIAVEVHQVLPTSSDLGFDLGISAVRFPPAESQGVLGNDHDAEGDAMTAVLVAGPYDGTLSFNSDGTFTYTPDVGFEGVDTFTYRASDGVADSRLALVTINVGDANVAPLAAGDRYVASWGATLSIPAAAGVLANDFDANGDALTTTVFAAPERGTLSLSADGGFDYTPPSNFLGVDSFTYRVADDAGTFGFATATIHVLSARDPVDAIPLAGDDAYAVDSAIGVNVVAPGVLSNDHDAELRPLFAVAQRSPWHGTLSFAADGSFVYTPRAGFVGEDSFSYVASDGNTFSAPATVTLTVAAATPAIAPPEISHGPPPLTTNSTTTSIASSTTTSPGTLPTLGDVNGDGRVDRADLAAVVAAYGSSSGTASPLGAADVDGDGRISVADAVAVRNAIASFGESFSSSAVVRRGDAAGELVGADRGRFVVARPRRDVGRPRLVTTAVDEALAAIGSPLSELRAGRVARQGRIGR